MLAHATWFPGRMDRNILQCNFLLMRLPSANLQYVYWLCSLKSLSHSLSDISNGCHSFSGVAEWLQHTVLQFRMLELLCAATPYYKECSFV